MDGLADELRLPVGALRCFRRSMPARPRRRSDLQAHQSRRRRNRQGPGDSEQRDQGRPSLRLGGERRRESRRRRPHQHRPPEHDGQRSGRPDPERNGRLMDGSTCELCLPVGALQQRRVRMRPDLRREQADLPGVQPRRRRDTPRRRQRRQRCRRECPRVLESHECGPGGSDRYRAPGHLRNSLGRPDADGDARRMDRLADELCLPVGALRCHGLPLRQRPGRQRSDLQARRRRSRLQDQGQGDGDQYRRPEHSREPRTPRSSSRFRRLRTRHRPHSRAPSSRLKSSSRPTARGKATRPPSPIGGSAATPRAANARRSRSPQNRPTFSAATMSVTPCESQRPPPTRQVRALPRSQPRAPSSYRSHP